MTLGIETKWNYEKTMKIDFLTFKMEIKNEFFENAKKNDTKQDKMKTGTYFY